MENNSEKSKISCKCDFHVGRVPYVPMSAYEPKSNTVWSSRFNLFFHSATIHNQRYFPQSPLVIELQSEALYLGVYKPGLVEYKRDTGFD